jgi:hypothetical protein
MRHRAATPAIAKVQNKPNALAIRARPRDPERHSHFCRRQGEIKQFASARRFSWWARVCPENNRSATTQGDRRALWKNATPRVWVDREQMTPAKPGLFRKDPLLIAPSPATRYEPMRHPAIPIAAEPAKVESGGKVPQNAKAVRKLSAGHLAVGASAVGAFALGSLAIGAMGIGALAIGRFFVRAVAAEKARVKSLEIDELKIKRLIVGDLTVADSIQLPITPNLTE